MVCTRSMAAKLEHSALAARSRETPCKFFSAGNGYCHRRKQCYYSHACAPKLQAPVQEFCSICYENPEVYGLLSECSHAFCLPCIKRWRRLQLDAGELDDGSIKLCPICRTASMFVTPSNYLPTPKQRKKLVEAKKTVCARIPCKHFVDSLRDTNGLQELTMVYCPWLNDCMYLHELDFKKFIFSAEHLKAREDHLDNEEVMSRGFSYHDDAASLGNYDPFRDSAAEEISEDEQT